MSGSEVLVAKLEAACRHLEDDDGGRLAAMLTIAAVLDHLNEIGVPRPAQVSLDRLYGALDDVERGAEAPRMFKAERSPGRAMPGNQFRALFLPAMLAVTLYVEAGLTVSDAATKVHRALKNRQAVAGKNFRPETIVNWRENLTGGRTNRATENLYRRALQAVREEGKDPKAAADLILARPLQ